MKHPLSVVIITKNEERNIERCLRSVRWADEIVILDSGSVDRTVEICRAYHCTIIQTPWLGFGRTKQKAIEAASNDWVLSLDADEEVTEALGKSVQTILENPDCTGYRIKRVSFYLGHEIRYSGWDRDYPLRLFNRTSGNFSEQIVHESIRVAGKVRCLQDPILHYSYPDVSTHVRKMNLYSDLAAEQSGDKPRRSSPCIAVIKGLLKFMNMFFLKKGFLDGRPGFILAFTSAFGVYLKYLKQWEKNR